MHTYSFELKEKLFIMVRKTLFRKLRKDIFTNQVKSDVQFVL